jgi:hypothetical protein
LRSNRKVELTTGPFPVAPKPGDEIASLFKKHCDKTFAPETFELLTLNAPKPGLRSEIVTKFDIPKNRRPNGKFIPCSFCGDAEKFLSGSLIWSEDCHLRIIGHVCSRTEFGTSNLRAMQARYSKEISLDAAESFLLAHWARVHELADEAAQLTSFAGYVDGYIASLKEKAPSFFSAIQIARQKGGALTIQRVASSIARELGMRTSGGSANFEEVEISRLIGISLFGSKEKYAPRLMKISFEIRDLAVSEDEMLNRLAARNEQQILKTRQVILESARAIVKLHGRLDSGREFFCPDNALAINKWAESTNQAEKVRASLIGATFRIYEHGALPVDANLSTLMALPQISAAWEILDT